MDKKILLILALFISKYADAQYAYFATRGKISFEKVSYIRARMRDVQQQMTQRDQGRFGGGRMFDLENVPESDTEKLVLTFDEYSTLMYTDETNSTTSNSANNSGQAARGRSSQGNVTNVRAGNRQGNPRSQTRVARNFSSSPKILFQDLKNQSSQIQVEIDDKYLISDSLQDITWRFSDEYRNIAGYECRRVNGATKDSLYVIAFYTEEIPISGGPALTHGLPGMILGLVIPEMHIQYWATKVEFTTETTANDWKDKKAKPLVFDEFVKSFGNFYQRWSDNTSSKRQVQEAIVY